MNGTSRSNFLLYTPWWISVFCSVYDFSFSPSHTSDLLELGSKEREYKAPLVNGFERESWDRVPKYGNVVSLLLCTSSLPVLVIFVHFKFRVKTWMKR